MLMSLRVCGPSVLDVTRREVILVDVEDLVVQVAQVTALQSVEEIQRFRVATCNKRINSEY